MLYTAWDDDWLDIIRDVIFPDTELKELMGVAPKTSILEFVNRYFVQAGKTTSELLTNEDIRVVYGFYPADSTDIPNAHNMTLSLDIYCPTEKMHTVGKDRLVARTQRIARRFLELLYIKPRDENYGYIGVFKFRDPHETVLGTRTIGYERHCLTMTFTRVY